jgi:hypothetical protein
MALTLLPDFTATHSGDCGRAASELRHELQSSQRGAEIQRVAAHFADSAFSADFWVAAAAILATFYPAISSERKGIGLSLLAPWWALSLVLALFFVAPASAATQLPEVRWEVASEVSATGATAEASINPEGGETSYEIWLECSEAPGINQQCEPLTANPQRRQGTLSPASESVIVTDAVTGLQPGTFYKYRVVATNSAGRSGIVGAGFRTCPSTGPCPMQPYAPGEALWNLEGAERAAEEAPRLEAEREAKRREEEERPAKEAAERAAKEREIREAGERAGREQVGLCVVPRLAGDSPKRARRTLRRAHCALGSIVKPHSGGRLVVVAQSVPSGVKRPPGFKVRVTCAVDGKQP